MTGKSTLVAALIRAGATYYSDEYAILDVWGRVHPYPKELSIRNAGGSTATRASPEQLGGVTGTDPLPVGLVAVTKWDPTAHWSSRSLSPGQAVLALLDNTLAARSRPNFALPILGRAVARATAIAVTRGEAEDAASALLNAKAFTCHERLQDDY